MPVVGQFGFADNTEYRRTRNRPGRRRIFLRHLSGKIRITVIVGDIMIVIDLDIP